MTIPAALTAVVSLVAAMFRSGDRGTSAAAGVGLVGLLAGLGGAAMWLLGPGREVDFCLNALELSAVFLIGGASTLFALWRRSPRDVPPYSGRY